MHDDPIELRQPDADTLRAWYRPASAAFGEESSDAEFEFERKRLEMDRLIGAVDGETWVGTGGAYTLQLTVPGGGAIGAAGITTIGVSPTHRRRGILRQMMRWLLDQARERGEPVAILWASEGAIYRNFGYGLGTVEGIFDIERSRARVAQPVEPLGRLRFVDVDEAMRLLPPIYEAIRPTRPGWVSRTETKWRDAILADSEWMRHGNGPKFIAVLEVDGVARGYALYRIKDNWEERGPNNTLTVMEVTGLDPAAERSIWEWILAIDLVGHVKGWRGPVSHPLLHQLAEPRRLGITVRDGLWLRILDVAAALERRGYASTGSLTFDLTDDYCTWNAGRWRLDVADGGVSVQPFTGDADLILDVSDLAAAYLGAFTFADLARAGRVGAGRAGAVTAADRLFATATAPWCTTMF